MARFEVLPNSIEAFFKKFSSCMLTIHSDMEATALLCSTVAGSYPRDTVFANRESIILIVVARRYSYVLHVGSWKLPLKPEHHC